MSLVSNYFPKLKLSLDDRYRIIHRWENRTKPVLGPHP
jgi:hypothetical protein